MNQSVVVSLLTGGGFVALAALVAAYMQKGKNDAEKNNTNVKTASEVVVLVKGQLDAETAKRQASDKKCDRQHINIARLRDYVDLLLAILRRNNIPEPTPPVLLEVDDQ